MTKHEKNSAYPRRYKMPSKQMENELGPLRDLPGKWKATGTGWNMIALPFKDAPVGMAPFRILMNQYDEELSFSFVDDNVPNRGEFVDQRVATIDYQQEIKQQIAADFPVSAEAGGEGLTIHHEPGLWVRVKDNQTNGIDLARLASIPHGNSVLCLGESSNHDGMPEIPPINALPFGRFEDLSTSGYDVNDDPYLVPYKHFIDNPFMGNVPDGIGFPGFNPRDMNQILRFANENVDIIRTVRLTVDSKREAAGISNMPFTVREAEPVSMKSTFWIQEIRGPAGGANKFRLQYSQVVMLDFFRPRQDEMPGRAQWPHVSICTLEKQDP